MSPSVRGTWSTRRRPFIYDTGLAPAAAGAAWAPSMPGERARIGRNGLHDNAARLAAALGIDTPPVG